MNYQKVIEELEHHAEEMESRNAAHRAVVCAIHALKRLTQERATHLDAMQYTVSVDKILRPDERHTRLEELLDSFHNMKTPITDAAYDAAIKNADTCDPTVEIERLCRRFEHALVTIKRGDYDNAHDCKAAAQIAAFALANAKGRPTP